ncbi:MAG: hypothetical protein N2422_02145 [Rhodobacteraceae bacterium]|nr:hypothetical protein [Paracoccaceae bacterium]
MRAARPCPAAALSAAMVAALVLGAGTGPAPAGGSPAGAEALATYSQSSGSLPPAHAWQLDVTIAQGGTLALRFCRGYRTEGPACHAATAVPDPGRVDAILRAARASGLAADPARRLEDAAIPVGGPTRQGTVRLDGAVLDLPAFPRPEDAPRVAAVLDAIAAAIPAALLAEAEAAARAP